MSWNRPIEKKEPVKERGANIAWKRGLLCAVIVIVGSVGAWLFLSSGDKPVLEPTTKKTAGRIKTVEPAATPKSVEVKTNDVPKVDENDPRRIVQVMSCTTNNSVGLIIEVVKRADGSTCEIRRPSHKPVFKYGTDQLLAMMLCQGKNHSIAPIPLRSGKGMDKAFLKSLEEPIVINDDDSDRVKEQKQTVIEARTQIKEMMDQGFHFSDILADHRRLFNENLDIRRKAMKELNEIHASGDAEGERKYRLKIDAALQQMGIEPLDDPMTREERMAAREASQLQKQQENAK